MRVRIRIDLVAPISLAFEELNLRRNPFGEPAPEEMAALTVVEVEQYVEQLSRPGFAVQYLGEAGRSKSTHLRGLHRFFPDIPYLKFPENTRIPKIPHAPVLFLDETQRLPPRLLCNDPNKVTAFYKLTGREIVALKVIFYIGFGRWLEALREIDRREMSQLVAVEAEIPAF